MISGAPSFGKGSPRKSKELTRDGRDEANGSDREASGHLADRAVRSAESAAARLPRLLRHDDALALDAEQVLDVGQEFVDRDLFPQEHVSELTEKPLNG